MNYILSGKIDSGKSTRALAIVQKLIRDGKTLSGFITPAHMEDGKKVGHDLILIDKNKFSEPIPFTRLHSFENSFKWRRFYFNLNAFNMGSFVRPRRTQDDNLVCDFFIMDEIGPLELEEKKGFYETMLAALKCAPNTLTVVREEMKERFCNEIKNP